MTRCPLAQDLGEHVGAIDRVRHEDLRRDIVLQVKLGQEGIQNVLLGGIIGRTREECLVAEVVPVAHEKDRHTALRGLCAASDDIEVPALPADVLALADPADRLDTVPVLCRRLEVQFRRRGFHALDQ